jgi:penicillin-binding protein 2
MLNTPHNTIFAAGDEHAEFIAPGSSLRLWLTGGLFTAAAAIILIRVAWVQTQLPGNYLESLTRTTVEEELLPARDGRILAESVVLAADVEQYAVQIHYRWLQRSVDPDWLKLQIRQRLSREERKDAELVAQTTQKIVNERQAMLQAVAGATGILQQELTARCERIEQQVQKVSDSVNRRLHGHSAESFDEEASEDETWLLLQWASAVREKLTTAPEREETPRIVVKEEESWHAVLEHVDVSVAAKIGEHPEVFPGVRVVASTDRTYPENDLAVHIVGARTKPTAEELTADKRPGGKVDRDMSADVLRTGRFGVEKSYNQRLTGIPGLRRTVRDRRQRIVSTEIARRPVSGRDVVLTIDVELQKLAEQLLAESLGDAERQFLLPAVDDTAEADAENPAPPEPEHIPTGGCAIVMEADSGRIVAAASAPDFDLTMFTEGTTAQWNAVNSDTRRPFVSRITGMALPPGSTFKIVTAIAGLQTGALTPSESFECHGFLTDPDEHRCLIYRLHGRGHGPVTLRTAMAQSCNVYFFDAAQRMGITPLAHWTDLLQFGTTTGIDLPFEKPGTVPGITGNASSASSEAAQRRFRREALGLSIGQSRLTVTPVQMARLMAFVANNGWLVTPHVVSDDGVARQATELDDSPYRVTRHRIPGVTDDTLAAVREGLLAAVEEPIGTGFRTIRLKDVQIAGKTGTAETSPGKPDHAWFAGYAPAANPRYVVVVVLEHGGSGSKAAGPLARELVRALSERGMLSDTNLTRSR